MQSSGKLKRKLLPCTENWFLNIRLTGWIILHSSQQNSAPLLALLSGDFYFTTSAADLQCASPFSSLPRGFSKSEQESHPLEFNCTVVRDQCSKFP